MYTTLARAKQILNLETDYTADDSLITMMIECAEASVENEIHQKFSGLTTNNVLPKPLEMAILKLVQHFYDNQGIVAYTSVNEIPYSFKFLYAPYINYASTPVLNQELQNNLNTTLTQLNEAIERVEGKVDTIDDKLDNIGTYQDYVTSYNSTNTSQQ